MKLNGTIILLSLLSFSILSNGQDIEGIPLGSVLTEEIIKEKFGKHYTVQDYTYFHNYKETVYIYGQDSLFVDSRNRLVTAKLHSRRFTIDKNSIYGGYHVGDRFCEDKFETLGIIKRDGLDKNNVFIYDKEDVCPIEITHLRNDRIKYAYLLFEFGDDVEGIGIHELVPKDVIEKKFGNADKVKECDFMDIPSVVYSFIDNGEESLFIFSKGGRLLRYNIYSSKFKTFTETISGGLSVGDSIEKASIWFDNEGHHRFLDISLNEDCPALSIKDGEIIYIGYIIDD